MAEMIEVIKMTEEAKIEYKEIEKQIAKLRARQAEINPYAKLKLLSNKAFGEGWSEPYIRSKVPNLHKNNGAGHDMQGIHYKNIEVKSSRIPFNGNWTENQLHPTQADAYLFIWYNCDEATEEFCLVPTKDLVENCSKSTQHGPGCFNLGSTIKNRQFLKKYMVPSFEALNEVV